MEIAIHKGASILENYINEKQNLWNMPNLKNSSFAVYCMCSEWVKWLRLIGMHTFIFYSDDLFAVHEWRVHSYV